MNIIGDTADTYNVPPHPPRTIAPNNITKVSGNALYWILQITVLLVTLTFKILCNPVVWFILRTSFNVITEVFLYLVLGACSFLISIITHLDDYYTKGRNQMKKMKESNEANKCGTTRDGVKVQNCTIKRFVETPKTF